MKLAFGQSAASAIAGFALVASVGAAGNTFAPEAAMEFADSIHHAAETGKFNPSGFVVNALDVTKGAKISMVSVAPGGFGKVAPAKGQVAYKPFDWANPVV